MADITFTASSVLIVAGATVRGGTAGAALTPGMAVYKDSSDSNKIKPADADAEASAAVVGINLDTCATGQPCDYIERGDLTCGSILSKGVPYFLSTNAGMVADAIATVTTAYTSLIGIAKSATVLAVNLVNSGNTQA